MREGVRVRACACVCVRAAGVFSDTRMHIIVLGKCPFLSSVYFFMSYVHFSTRKASKLRTWERQPRTAPVLAFVGVERKTKKDCVCLCILCLFASACRDLFDKKKTRTCRVARAVGRCRLQPRRHELPDRYVIQ